MSARKDFNSLDAQYDASQAYIRSQAHAGWTRSKYDGGGFSGGNTDRPALQKLLEDVRAGKVDVIVVYKVECPTGAPNQRPRIDVCGWSVKRYNQKSHRTRPLAHVWGQPFHKLARQPPNQVRRPE